MTGPLQATIPLPIQIVIDDVGWWSGRNGSADREPFRTGIARAHVPADYAAIVSLGRQLGVKPQAGFTACEWDRENILREIPSCTWMGETWDNSRWLGPWQEEAAQIIRDGQDGMELMLHGIGHEFWANDADGRWNFTRAEWYDTEGKMRPHDEVLKRFELFQRILAQHDLGDFPTTFVPCAFMHRFEDSHGGLAPLLRSAGVDFISTPFSTMHGSERVRHTYFDFDSDVLTVDRGTDLQNWYVIGTPPEGELSGPILGLHWPNLLHLDPERNEEVVRSWVNFLKREDQKLNRTLSPDTGAFAVQILHHTLTQFGTVKNGLEFDYSKFRAVPSRYRSKTFTVKITGPGKLNFNWSGEEMSVVKTTPNSITVDYEIRLQPSRKLFTDLLTWQVA